MNERRILNEERRNSERIKGEFPMEEMKIFERMRILNKEKDNSMNRSPKEGTDYKTRRRIVGVRSPSVTAIKIPGKELPPKGSRKN